MKEVFLKTVRRNGTSLAINIPKEVINALDIKDGDVVRIVIEKPVNSK